MDTDAQLLGRADCDPDAFALFYARHERAVVTFVGSMVRDAERVVDATAETFARAYESRRSFSGEGARAWLLGIARHVVLAGWRRDARERLGIRALAASARRSGGECSTRRPTPRSRTRWRARRP
jgi:DNA-directed RNA polymerase specialized sigma24 family protein